MNRYDTKTIDETVNMYIVFDVWAVSEKNVIHERKRDINMRDNVTDKNVLNANHVWACLNVWNHWVVAVCENRMNNDDDECENMKDERLKWREAVDIWAV